MEAFGAHRWPKDAKMDPKDGPQTSRMTPKIDENLGRRHGALAREIRRGSATAVPTPA